MATILLTGVTGLVGSCLATLYRNRGHNIIYLIRSQTQKGAVNRLHHAIGHVDSNDVVINGDVTLPGIGLNEQEKNMWRGKIDKIIHSAGSVKFDENSATDTWRTNFEGTNNLLNLARELEIPEFHFISTAYVAGNAQNFTEKDFELGQKTRNAYEMSKKAAETLVRNWQFGKFSIYRPSIIVGDSKTGYVKALNGYYGFFITFWRLLHTLQKRWAENRAECTDHGIDFHGQFLNLPLVMHCSPTSTLNLIPTDWLAQMLIELINLPAANQTFHLTHPNPPKVQWVIEASLHHLKIGGLQYGDQAQLDGHKLLARLQRGMEKELTRYRPYITHEPSFECDNLKNTLKERYIAPPAIDEAFLKKMLDYAKSIDFDHKHGEMAA